VDFAHDRVYHLTLILLRDLLVFVHDDVISNPLPVKREHATVLEQIHRQLKVGSRVADSLVVTEFERGVVVRPAERICNSDLAFSDRIELGLILVVHEVPDAVGVVHLLVLELTPFFVIVVIIGAIAVIQVAIVTVVAVLLLDHPLHTILAHVVVNGLTAGSFVRYELNSKRRTMHKEM
jgi:hypothetical protein